MKLMKPGSIDYEGRGDQERREYEDEGNAKYGSPRGAPEETVRAPWLWSGRTRRQSQSFLDVELSDLAEVFSVALFPVESDFALDSPFLAAGSVLVALPFLFL